MSRTVFVPGLVIVGIAALALGLLTLPHPDARAQSPGDAWLGVRLQELDTDLRESLELDRRLRGVLVSDVVPGSPADRAGLEDGDVITRIDGDYVRDVDELIDAVRKRSPGDEAEVHVERDGRSRTLGVTLGSMDDDGFFDDDVRRHYRRDRDVERERERAYREREERQRHREHTERAPRVRTYRFDEDAPGGYLGVRTMGLEGQLAEYFGVEDETGVLVTEVVEDSPASRGGLVAGDVIVSVNDAEIRGPGSLRRAVRDLEPDEEVRVGILRDGARRSLQVVLGDARDSGDLWFGPENNTWFGPHGGNVRRFGNGPTVIHLDDWTDWIDDGDLDKLRDMTIDLDLPNFQFHWDGMDDEDLDELRRGMDELREHLKGIRIEIDPKDRSVLRERIRGELRESQAEARGAQQVLRQARRELQRELRQQQERVRRLGKAERVRATI